MASVLAPPNDDAQQQQQQEEVATAANPTTTTSTYRKIAATLMITFVLTIFIPLGVLGSALEWPDNLSEDADHNLPLLLEESPSVFWGYFSYLLYSILFFPMGHMMANVLLIVDTMDDDDHDDDDGNGKKRKKSTSTNDNTTTLLLVQLASGFAALSALARSIGLCRWLFAMPTLARIYIDPNTAETTKAAVSISYEMLNSWGGGIGEILGVSIFASMWVICTSLLFITSSSQHPGYRWPSWMGYIGFLVAVDLFINMFEMSILNYDMGMNLTLSVVFLHLWILLAALMFLQCPCCNKCVKAPPVDDDDDREDL